ncbi:MAG: zinc ribbon domain-containing protein [Candidatus Binatia bacterium]
MNCPACRHENPLDSAFCEECGARLERLCPSCGTACAAAAKFCRSCGTSLAVRPSPARDEAAGRKIVTILFSDLIGSVALQERLDPGAPTAGRRAPVRRRNRCRSHPVRSASRPPLLHRDDASPVYLPRGRQLVFLAIKAPSSVILRSRAVLGLTVNEQGANLALHIRRRARSRHRARRDPPRPSPHRRDGSGSSAPAA